MSGDLQRSAGLFPEYLKKLKEGWDALVGGLVLTGALALLDWLKVPWFKDAPAWLYVLLLCLGVFFVQFKLWAAEVLRNEKTVSLKLERLDCQLIDSLPHGTPTPWNDALIVEIDLMIRNDGEACRSFYPTPRLYKRRGKSKWEEVRVDQVSSGGGAKLRGEERRIMNVRWYPGRRLEIPARDELHAALSIVLLPEGGAAAVTDKDLKLSIPLDIPGLPSMPLLEAPLPRIKDYRWRTSSADPAPSTPSG